MPEFSTFQTLLKRIDTAPEFGIITHATEAPTNGNMDSSPENVKNF